MKVSSKVVKPVLRLVVIYIALSLLLGALALLQSFPARPESWVGWLALFALVLPLTLLGELVGEWLRTNHIAESVKRRTITQRFSWRRVSYLLFAGLLVAAGVTWLSWVVA